MNTKEKIEEDFKKALKRRKEIELSTLRMLKAEIFNREKEKRYKLAKQEPDLKEGDLEKESQLNDEEVIEALFSEIKKRKESLLEFEKGKREDLIKKTKEEIAVLKKYLPEQISEAEIKKLAKEAIEETGSKNPKDMGKVMGNLMPKLKGKAEGTIVSKIVKELLSEESKDYG